MGTSCKIGVSAWHKLTLCLVFNGGLYQRDNVLESQNLNYVSGSSKKGYTPPQVKGLHPRLDICI